jgi:hypothetical protein
MGSSFWRIAADRYARRRDRGIRLTPLRTPALIGVKLRRFGDGARGVKAC